MDEEKLNRVLPQVFRRVKVNQKAKEALRQKLFGAAELSDDALSLVTAAGDLAEQAQKNESQNPEE
jgi:hypothetical protein